MTNLFTAIREEKCTRAKLSDFIKVKHGFAFKGEDFSSTPTKDILVTPGNFAIGGGFKDDKLKYYDGPVSADYVLRAGDLIVTMTDLSVDADTLGYPALVPDEQGCRYLHNQRVGLVQKEKEGVDLGYLYYLMRTREYQSYVVSTASGSTVRHTSPDRISAFVHDFPSLPMQKKISQILGAYDKKIENNNRIIKNLEDILQTIFDEWFIKFRFPDHGGVTMVDSGTEFGATPVGWEVKTFGDIAIDKRQQVDPNLVDKNTPYIGLEHIPRNSIVMSGWGNASDVVSTKLLFEKGDVLFGKIRPYLHKVIIACMSGITSSDTIVISASEKKYSALVLMMASSINFVSHATATSQGTQMPRADWKSLAKYPIVIPNSKILNSFNNIAERLFEEMNRLMFQNRNLATSRDLLIPRLVINNLEDKYTK